MLNKHVAKHLSAYCHGELTAEESRRVAEHLLACERCRREYDEIKLGVQLAERLPQVSAPVGVWGEIEALLDGEMRKPALQMKARRFAFAFSPYTIAAASAALIVAVVTGIVYFRNYGPRPSWEVEILTGAPRIGGDSIGAAGRLAVGESLETDGASRARISVGAIGQVDISPNSHVRLIETDLTEHRLALDRGRMEAHIWAPPRLFFVDTPSAEAIDLGCAYTLEVDDAGKGFLHVTSGWVALVRDGRESYVPIGAMCETRPGVGPGTPYFEDVSDRFRQALGEFNFENGGAGALNTVLSESRRKDTFTLWHLLQRVDGSERARVLDQMIALVGLPEGVTRQGILDLDHRMLEDWKDELYMVWF
ncbi:MAG TPA: zf-HC2 domain-containing protein [Blastocatellia bacterium]